jgi:putative ABC transport system permease protein
MIKNYFKVAWRNMKKNKFFSIINICGLAMAMMVGLLNGLWIMDELNFNKFHQHYNTIAKVTKKGITHEGKLNANPSLPLPLVEELRTSYGQYFDQIILSSGMQETIITVGEKKLSKKGQFMEPGAPELFTLKMLKGTRAGLRDMNSILLSSSVAKALFGDADPMDKTIKINTNMDVKVTGVYEDLPSNTELHEVSFFAPFDLWASANPWVRKQGWDNHFLDAYVQIKANGDFEKISSFIKDAEFNRIKGLEDRKEEVARNRKVWLLPMSSWHLHAELDSNGPVQMVWMVGLIGVFVLLLACINFMNLSTARSEKRAKEVGIRKTIGSMRHQLIKQFFSESFLVVVLAFTMALGMTIIFLPWFNQIAAKQMSLPLTNVYFWLACFCFILLTALLAGSYPALYLSSFRPVKVLKGTFRAGRWADTPRKVLVVVQFSVSVILIIGTLVIYSQIDFARDRPIGYNKKGLLQIEKKTGEFYGKYEVFRTELMNTGVVEEMAESRSSTTAITMWNAGFYWKGKEIELPRGCGTLSVTSGYGKTVGWEFLGGRDFARELSSDSSSLVINESFAALMGLKNPVGEFVVWNPGWREPKTYTVIGVVKDMVALSPYEPTIPSVFFLEKYLNWINIRIKPEISAAAALSKIEAVFKKLTPSAPFNYQFADEEYDLKFTAEVSISKLATFFAVLAIFISCLGIFGLASFVAEQRTKEIGVRKVLGASVFGVWKLLSKNFVVLVILSCVIAAPIANYFLQQWLQKYEYRTTIGWEVFAIAMAGAIVITLLTVSYQAIKAAIANPVRALRSE